MTVIAFRARPRSHMPRLKLVPIYRSASAVSGSGNAVAPSGRSSALRLAHGPTRGGSTSILVAGRDATQRAAVLDELSRTMPPSTVFAEADAFCQVLERAPDSRIVVLSGELDDGPADSLMQKLAHRHPGLPVVSLEAAAPAGL